MSIDNKKIKDWASNNTNLQLINQDIMSFKNSSIIYQPYNLSQTNKNINPIYQTELETSTHKHRHEKSRNRHKRGYNDDRNEIEFVGHFLGRGGTAYCSFKPEFWEEIVYLKINNNKSEFEKKFKDKVFKKIWISWSIEDSHDVRLIGEIIYDNFWKIANTFIDSSRKQRIRIVIDNSWNGWTKVITYTYVSSNIRTDENQRPNAYLENLQRDLPIWNSYKTFNLGIINNNDNDFKNAIKQKYPNFIRLEEISIVDKEEYSNFCKCFKFKLYVYNMNYYSFGNLRPTFSYTTQTKINELNNIIANDWKVKQWLKHITEWYSSLPSALSNTRTFSSQQLYNWKRQEKEVIKSYIRDWSYVSTLIEHEFKLDELNKNIEGLKSSFETLKNQINELENRVTNLENASSLNCANIATIRAGIVSVIPVIGTVAGAVATITSGSCAIAGV